MAPGFLWRYRLSTREVLAARWREMTIFYERGIWEQQKLLVCRDCERTAGTNPAAATLVTVVFDGPAIWAICHLCGRKERIGSK